MNAIATPGPLELLMLILLGGGGGLTSSLPPGPEDPQAANIAPAECLLYTSWAGTVRPDSSSSNATEQLLAEPEVEAFFARVGMLQNFQAGFADAHVRFISESVDKAMLQGMFTKNGGERININGQ